MRPTSNENRTIRFEGQPGAFITLVALNTVLTVVTLGIYRFWAKAAVRRYLWSHTRVLGEPLEWRGTGLQLFLGALLTLVVVGFPLAIVQLALVTLARAGQVAAAAVVYVGLIIGIAYLVNVGLYRSWRYLLAWTSWRGIRGGMATGGWSFGWLGLRMMLLQFVGFGLTQPYTTIRLWNARWNDASFGSTPFRSQADWRPLFRRFWPILLGSLLFFLVYAGVVAATVGSQLPGLARPDSSPPAALLRTLALLYLGLLGGALLLGLLLLRYHAAWWREAIGNLSLGGLRLGFQADGRTWLRYYLTNVALLVFTLGLGSLFMSYRHFGFFAARLTTVGALDADDMLQTDLAQPRHGDGIADAFDLAGV